MSIARIRLARRTIGKAKPHAAAPIDPHVVIIDGKPHTSAPAAWEAFCKPTHDPILDEVWTLSTAGLVDLLNEQEAEGGCDHAA